MTNNPPPKICSRCDQEKTYDKFHIDKNRSTYNSHMCKKCIAAVKYKKYYQANREKKKAAAAEYRKNNIEKVRATARKKYRENPQKFLDKGKAHVARNTEKTKAYGQAYRAKNVEKLRVQSKAWRTLNAEKLKAKRAAYVKNNPEKVKATRRAYYFKHAEKFKAQSRNYRKNNPEIRRAQARKRRAQKAKVNENFTIAQAATTRSVFNYRCFNCSSTENLTFDHHRPLIEGNPLEPGNATLLCLSCNSSKRSTPPEEFYSPEQLAELNRLLKLAEEL